MGSDAEVIVSGGTVGEREQRLHAAQRRLEQLENRWSRFMPESEVSRLNRSVGPQEVSFDTFRLIKLAVAGWERTGGRFDPTVHDAVISAGYGDAPPVNQLDARPAPGCGAIRFDDGAQTIELPPAIRFDPGGIGKGLAADIVSGELLAAGAAGALVSIGGDLRVRGRSPHDAGWMVDVVEPAVVDSAVARLILTDGAVATSTTERRMWTIGGDRRHHLIDPTNGRCHQRTVRLVTVVSRDCWWAEVCTKPLFGLAGRGLRDRLQDGVADAEAIVVAADGTVDRSSGFDRFER